MCEECGCGHTHDPVSVEVHERVLAGNDAEAAHLRSHFAEAKVLAINLMGSPGSGKTAVLEATAKALKTSGRGWTVGAVSGDLATDNDAVRLRAAGIAAAAITTGSACHLDARLLHDELHHLAWRDLDVLFVENVGNLVCPAIYDLGQAAKVVALSVTEGPDKPLKYPVMFRTADLVLITKTDLLPHLPQVSVQEIKDNLARVMPKPRAIEISATTGVGVEAFVAWLAEQRNRLA